MKPLKTCKFVAVLACGVLACWSLVAEDKKDDKDKPSLSGVWVRSGRELKIEFADKDVMRISPHGENPVIIIICKYTLEKDGLVKAKVSEFEGKEEAKEMVKAKLPVGSEFSFKWQAKNDSATLDGVKGDKADVLQDHLEGKYEPKK